jgi:hypothetical protein
MLTFKTLHDAWNLFKRNRRADVASRVPSLGSMEHVKCELISERTGGMMVQFSGLEQAVDEVEDVPRLKNAIISWIRSFADVRLDRGTQAALVVLVSGREQAQKPGLERHGEVMREAFAGIRPSAPAEQTARIVGRAKIGG